MRAAADKIRKEVEDEIAEIDENVIKLREVLEMFSDESLGRLKAAKEQIDNAQNSIRKGKSSTVKPCRCSRARSCTGVRATESRSRPECYSEARKARVCRL